MQLCLWVEKSIVFKSLTLPQLKLCSIVSVDIADTWVPTLFPTMELNDLKFLCCTFLTWQQHQCNFMNKKSEERFSWVLLRFCIFSINILYQYETILRWMIKGNICFLPLLSSNIILYSVINFVIDTRHQVNLPFSVNIINIPWPLVSHICC